MSNDYVPILTDLSAGELARSSDINLRYSYTVSGFDLLPQPRTDGTIGFLGYFTVQEPTDASHPATKNFVETGVTSQLVLAQTAATNAGTSETNALVI